MKLELEETDSSDDESLSQLKRKIMQSKEKRPRGRPRKENVENVPEKDGKFVKPIKKRAYKAESENDDDDDDENFEPSDSKKKDIKDSSFYKGPQISADLVYKCLHESCKSFDVYDTAFAFVDHMEVSLNYE